MDAKFLSDIATSQAVWAICCILLVGFILKKVYEKNDKQEDRLIVLHDEYRTESKERETESRERENKLMEHLARSDQAQERTAVAIEGINTSLNKLEIRVDNIEKNSFKNGDA